MTSRSTTLIAAACTLLAGGCTDTTEPEGSGNVRLAFATTSRAAGSLNGAVAAARVGAGERVIIGSNGTLRITDVRMIVAEFDLEGVGVCLDDDDGDFDECEFEAPPFLLDLPLDGRDVIVASDDVPLGTYTELEFEIEDLDEDEDDEPRTRQAIATLRSQLRAAFPGFPSEASMVVAGSFTPAGGTARPFVVYLDADVEVELALIPPLVVSDAGASRTLTVQLDPDRWFVRGGEVLDLSAFDGRLIEFEDDFRGGIAGVGEDHD